MVSALRPTTASLVLVGSLLLSEHSDAAPTASNNGRRSSSGGGNDNRQLRTRKLSKGAKKQYEPQSDGMMARTDNGGGTYQPPVLAGCFRDFKVCDSTGTLVSRNPLLGCDFDPCPPGEGHDKNNNNDGNGNDAAENNDTEGNAPKGQTPVYDNNDETPEHHPIQIIEENVPVTSGESNNEYTEGDFLLPNGAWVDCNWVAKKKTEERCQDKTASNELVSDLCPDVCNAATIAAILKDNTPTAVSTAPIKFDDIINTSGAAGNFTLTSGMIVDCDWVEKRVESRCFKKTDDGSQVRYLCPMCAHVVEVIDPIAADNTTDDGL